MKPGLGPSGNAPWREAGAGPAGKPRRLDLERRRTSRCAPCPARRSLRRPSWSALRAAIVRCPRPAGGPPCRPPSSPARRPRLTAARRCPTNRRARPTRRSAPSGGAGLRPSRRSLAKGESRTQRDYAQQPRRWQRRSFHPLP